MANAMKEIFGSTLRGAESEEEATMKDKCARDFKLFCEYYLADSFKSKWSEFHLWLIKKIEDVVLRQYDEETRNVVAAPRGHAKSTLTSFAFPIWCACYGYKRFIVIISATGPVAKQFIVDIRNELEFNDRIRNDFGDMKNPDIWNSTELLTVGTKVFITGRGAGAQMRGMKFNSRRPELVILDDLETPEQVASPSQNAALHTWFNSDVMPMGSPTCSFFYIGTVLSYDSLLYHMLNDGEYSSWVRKRFKAVIEFSLSPLWQEWEDIMVDLERGDEAYNDAKKFYMQHKKEMLQGTKILWENQRPEMYLYLMERRLADEEGFASEFQNDPITENTRVFKTEWLENNLYIDHPEIKDVCIAIDPAFSTKRRNDYSVITVVARCADNYFYVLESDADKRRAETLQEDAKTIIARYYNYNPRIVCETTVFQQFFANTLKRDLIQSGIYLDWIEVTHAGRESKQRRIESLVPHIKQGHIKFKQGQTILLSQLRNYPKGHDDAPDCLQMAMEPLLQTSVASFSFGSIETSSEKHKKSMDNFLKFFRRG